MLEANKVVQRTIFKSEGMWAPLNNLSVISESDRFVLVDLGYWVYRRYMSINKIDGSIICSSTNLANVTDHMWSAERYGWWL